MAPAISDAARAKYNETGGIVVVKHSAMPPALQGFTDPAARRCWTTAGPRSSPDSNCRAYTNYPRIPMTGKAVSLQLVRLPAALARNRTMVRRVAAINEVLKKRLSSKYRADPAQGACSDHRSCHVITCSMRLFRRQFFPIETRLRWVRQG